MDGLRIVLILLAVLVIIALLAHGLWTIRKNNQQDKEQRQEIERKRRQVDQQGFDELGVGAVRTVDHGRKEPAIDDVDSDSAESDALESGAVDDSESDSRPPEPAKAAKAEPKPGPAPEPEPAPEQPSMFAETSENPDTPANDSSGTRKSGGGSEKKPEPALKTQANDIEQLPMDLPYEDDSEVDEDYPKQEVISLFVSGDIQGAALLQSMTELGLKFGDMDIFERHESPSGHGPVLFRVADMYQPGTFDLDQIENHSTRGIALFMALPLDYDGHKAFTMMYNAANKIAEAMPRAAVLDGNRNPITKQSVQHTYQKIREFERRQKLTGRR